MFLLPYLKFKTEKNKMKRDRDREEEEEMLKVENVNRIEKNALKNL